MQKKKKGRRSCLYHWSILEDEVDQVGTFCLLHDLPLLVANPIIETSCDPILVDLNIADGELWALLEDLRASFMNSQTTPKVPSNFYFFLASSTSITSLSFHFFLGLDTSIGLFNFSLTMSVGLRVAVSDGISLAASKLDFVTSLLTFRYFFSSADTRLTLERAASLRIGRDLKTTSKVYKIEKTKRIQQREKKDNLLRVLYAVKLTLTLSTIKNWSFHSPTLEVQPSTKLSLALD